MAKGIAKKIAKLSKIPHPKGRKAAQLTKKTIKAAGREKVKTHNQMRVNITGEKVMWFKENLEPVESYTPELTIELVEKYLGRFDEELKQIELKHSVGKRKGRQHANREDIIKMTIKNERNEFMSCGIEMPNVLNSEQLKLLRSWSGELRYLQNFKLVRYSKSKLENMKSSTKSTAKDIKENQNLEEDSESGNAEKESHEKETDKVTENNEKRNDTEVSQMDVD